MDVQTRKILAKHFFLPVELVNESQETVMSAQIRKWFDVPMEKPTRSTEQVVPRGKALMSEQQRRVKRDYDDVLYLRFENGGIS